MPSRGTSQELQIWESNHGHSLSTMEGQVSVTGSIMKNSALSGTEGMGVEGREVAQGTILTEQLSVPRKATKNAQKTLAPTSESH